MVIDPAAVPERGATGYPEPFASDVRDKRWRRALGDAGGLTQFGVNLVRITPGGWSAQRHWHHGEDELIYVLEGELVLVTDEGETLLKPGAVCAFKAGVANGHHLQNRSDRDALCLEVGTRDPNDVCEYPDVDLLARGDGYFHKDGTPY
jgi:uncharacterized cupin superfamily protein